MNQGKNKNIIGNAIKISWPLLYAKFSGTFPVNPIIEDVVEITITELENSCPTITHEYLTVEVRKLFNLLTKLHMEEEHGSSCNHIFICPDDLKYVCNITNVPNVKLKFGLGKIYVHYIPSLNKSFMMSDQELKI
jgi:hypothetical protein